MKNFLVFAIIAFSLLSLSGCSNQADLEQIEQLKEENKQIEQLKAENEQLQADLEMAAANLRTAENRVEELESEIAGMSVKRNAEKNAESFAENITPPSQSAKESLIGEWHLKDIYGSGAFSYIQSMLFRSDGSGKICQTYYVPNDMVPSIKEQLEHGIVVEDFDMNSEFSWSLNGDTLKIDLDTGETGVFTFSPEQSELQLKTDSEQTQKYTRELPSALEEYTRRAFLAETSKANEARKNAIKQSFLGSWYYDVLIWTFNEDGTGLLDIPEIGDSPAEQRAFEYELSIDGGGDGYIMLMIEFSNDAPSSAPAYFIPTFNIDGSLTLESPIGDSDPILLTRNFDIDNCPLTKQIIESGFGILTGSAFEDILPQL